MRTEGNSTCLPFSLHKVIHLQDAALFHLVLLAQNVHESIHSCSPLFLCLCVRHAHGHAPRSVDHARRESTAHITVAFSHYTT